jgi:hypothetical protein
MSNPTDPENPESTNDHPEQTPPHSPSSPDDDSVPGFMETDQSLNSYDDPYSPPRERHGCVTAWLILMIIANSVLALIYLFTANKLAQTMNIPIILVVALVILGVANVIFSVMLWSWKKSGFYGFVITGIIAFFINISIGISPVRCVLGLIGIAILYGILQIKNDGISAWENLE